MEVGGSKTLLRMLKIDLTGLICKAARAEKSKITFTNPI